MTGKVKVQGNILLLQKLYTFWKSIYESRRDPELPLVKDFLFKGDLIEGLKSEMIMPELVQRLVLMPNLCQKSALVVFTITKNGHIATKWSKLCLVF